MRFSAPKARFFSVILTALLLGSYAIHRTDQRVRMAAKDTTASSSNPEGPLAGKPVAATPGSTMAPNGNQLPVSTVRKPAVRAAALLAQTTYFERNDGQADPQVLFTSHGADYTLFLTRTGITVLLPGSRKRAHVTVPAKPDFFRLQFVGASLQPQVNGVDQLRGISNYFGGSNPKLWHTHIPHFAKVRYSGIYPGIDVIFYFRDGHLEYDLDTAPGANVSAFHLKAERAKLSLAADGDIKLKVGTTETITLARPRAYQGTDNAKLVRASYVVRGDNLSFALDRYDRQQSLVVDPALIFSTYLNSNCPPVANGLCEDSISGIAADTTGVYVVGWTNATSFPATSGKPAPTLGNVSKTFVLKLDPTGSQIIYVTYLSSSTGSSIAVDATGAAYVSGMANASPAPAGVANFPLTSGVFSGTIPPVPPAGLTQLYNANAPFATKLSPDGSQIEYSTLLLQFTPNEALSPNAQFVTVTQVAVDSSGDFYLTGNAKPDSPGIGGEPSFWMPLPVTTGAFQTTPGGLFVLKLNPTASGFDYGTYIDGTQVVDGNNTGYGFSAAGIALDSSGDAYVTGVANQGFPTTPGAYETSTGSGFVTELNPTGSGEVYSTFFPGAGLGIAVDSQGEAIIVGGAGSGFPTTPNAFCTVPSGGSVTDGFVAKLNATGTGLIYSTGLCGSLGSLGYADAVAVDSSGGTYVTGETSDPQAVQQVLTGAIQSYIPDPSGVYAKIAMKLNAAGSLQWATFVGSGNVGIGVSISSIAVDPSQSIYLLHDSVLGGFPTTQNTVGLRAPGVAPAGGNSPDDFLLKIAPSLGAPVPLALLPSVSFPAQNVGTPSAPSDVELGNFGDAQLSSAQISTTGDFSETDNCSGGVAAGQKCDINVVFTPTATGSRTGTLNLGFGGGIASQTVLLSGTATAPVASVSPTSLSFGDQATGTTSPAQQVTVTNTGTGALTISSIQTTTQFAATNTCGGPIATNGNCTIQVTFTPNASGPQTGTLTIMDNAAGSPQTVALSGNQPAGFTIAPGGGSSSTSATVNAGQTANYSLSLAGTNGFSGAVSFTCAGAPSYSTCTVSPNPANLSGTSAMPVSISVSTQAGSDAVPFGIRLPKIPTQKEFVPAIALALAMLGSFLFIGTGAASRKRLFAGAALLLATVVVAAGCGAGSYTPPKQSKTPSGQYTLAVTATSGSVTQSTNLTLTVN